jgi:ribonuclease P protein component
VLATRPAARSAHFAFHVAPSPVVRELSTGGAPTADVSVDDCLARAAVAVPKRFARRAVTRSALKRQMRAAMTRHAATFAGSDCVMRLRAPFPTTLYGSAASGALVAEARRELDDLFAALH